MQRQAFPPNTISAITLLLEDIHRKLLGPTVPGRVIERERQDLRNAVHIACKTDVNCVADPVGCLGWAVADGVMNAFRYLRDELGAVNEPFGNRGFTPLRSALGHSHLDMVRFLVKGIDADVSKANTVDDTTPLIVAAGQLHLDTVRFLAQETQVDVNKAHAVDGATPLITAASHVNKAHAVDSAFLNGMQRQTLPPNVITFNALLNMMQRQS